MQLPPSEKEHLTRAICPEPECGTENPVHLRFGEALIRCKSCGNDFWVKNTPAWMEQQLSKKSKNGTARPAGHKFSSYQATPHLASVVSDKSTGCKTRQPKTPRSSGSSQSGWRLRPHNPATVTANCRMGPSGSANLLEPGR